ncbi:glycosyltransferase family 2 protein [Citrobacter freundii]|jgi:glycosyltransferase involved in cell wall biosynthesis|uniref:glycosyltransferase family 2 protein n=1 Tax=Citrobacter freundii TaxID=546 RepID=UPI0015E95E91|nr:glycosyltransferase family 2 protein [Citrobacter freundii]QMB05660.1 glycosyltransferase family 2 protein [Citrobacter freundii]
MITIVTPSFNSANYVKLQYERLKPILSEKIRWLIIDDYSVDNTLEYVKEFQSPFVECHRLGANGGPSKARYLGVSLAQTEYVFFLDADDLLLNNVFLDFLDFVISDNNRFDYFFAPTYATNCIPSGNDINFKPINDCVIIRNPCDFLYHSMPNFSSLAVKRTFFTSYIKENNLPWGEDIVSYLLMGNYGVGVKWIKPVSCYIITGNGRGSSLSLNNRMRLFYTLIKESLVAPRKMTSILFSCYIIGRYLCSYLYKKIRG